MPPTQWWSNWRVSPVKECQCWNAPWLKNNPLSCFPYQFNGSGPQSRAKERIYKWAWWGRVGISQCRNTPGLNIIHKDAFLINSMDLAGSDPQSRAKERIHKWAWWGRVGKSQCLNTPGLKIIHKDAFHINSMDQALRAEQRREFITISGHGEERWASLNVRILP